jgi:hypothetical protein
MCTPWFRAKLEETLERRRTHRKTNDTLYRLQELYEEMVDIKDDLKSYKDKSFCLWDDAEERRMQNMWNILQVERYLLKTYPIEEVEEHERCYQFIEIPHYARKQEAIGMEEQLYCLPKVENSYFLVSERRPEDQLLGGGRFELDEHDDKEDPTVILRYSANFQPAKNEFLFALQPGVDLEELGTESPDLKQFLKTKQSFEVERLSVTIEPLFYIRRDQMVAHWEYHWKEDGVHHRQCFPEIEWSRDKKKGLDPGFFYIDVDVDKMNKSWIRHIKTGATLFGHAMVPTLVLAGEGLWMNYFLESKVLHLKVNVQLALNEGSRTQESFYAPSYFWDYQMMKTQKIENLIPIYDKKENHFLYDSRRLSRALLNAKERKLWNSANCPIKETNLWNCVRCMNWFLNTEGIVSNKFKCYSCVEKCHEAQLTYISTVTCVKCLKWTRNTLFGVCLQCREDENDIYWTKLRLEKKLREKKFLKCNWCNLWNSEAHVDVESKRCGWCERALLLEPTRFCDKLSLVVPTTRTTVTTQTCTHISSNQKVIEFGHSVKQKKMDDRDFDFINDWGEDAVKAERIENVSWVEKKIQINYKSILKDNGLTPSPLQRLLVNEDEDTYSLIKEIILGMLNSRKNGKKVQTKKGEQIAYSAEGILVKVVWLLDSTYLSVSRCGEGKAKEIT